MRRLEGDTGHTFDEHIRDRRGTLVQAGKKTAISHRQLIDPDRRAAGAIAAFVALPRHHGGKLGNRLRMDAWQRLACGKLQFQGRGQWHADVCAGKRLEIGRHPDRRSWRMTTYVERQDYRVLIAEIVEPEGIETFRKRPCDPSLQAGGRTLRQVDNRRQPRLAGSAPVNLPSRRKDKLDPEGQYIQIARGGGRRDQAHLADRRIALPRRLVRQSAAAEGCQKHSKAGKPCKKTARIGVAGKNHVIMAPGPWGD